MAKTCLNTAHVGACVRGAPSASATARPELANGGPASAAPAPAAPSSPAGPCVAEQTTLAIDTCITERHREIEGGIDAALIRLPGVLTLGRLETPPLIAASQTDWDPRGRKAGLGGTRHD